MVARDTPKRLIAYVVPQQDADLTSEALQARIRQALSHALPDYMQPAVIMVLARIPLTRHGKVTIAHPEPAQTLPVMLRHQQTPCATVMRVVAKSAQCQCSGD